MGPGNGHSPGFITLNRYEKRSGSLSTELTGESDEYLYFTSEVPGYASFVITGNTTQEVLEEESDQVP